MKEVRTVLVIGYGSMGRRRIRLIKELLPDAEIICVDSCLQRQIMAREDGHISLPTIDKGLEQFPDIAFVCTPPGHHAEIILKLIESHVSVFTELNLVSDKYDIIAEKAKKNGVVVFLSSTMIYKKQISYFESIASSRVKPLTYIFHVGQYLPDWHPWENYKDFFASKSETNAIREILAVQLPWIIDVFGEVSDVKVLCQKCTDLDIHFPDSVLLSFSHKNGNIGSFAVDITSRKAITKLEIIGEELYILWEGHNDDLKVLNLDTKELDTVLTYNSTEHIRGYSDIIIEEPYRDEIREFLMVLNGKKARYGLSEDAYILGLIDRIESNYKLW